MDQAKKQAEATKVSAYAIADQALKANNTNADNLANTGNNPLQKAANKKAADIMRQKGVDENKKAKANADQAETNAINPAQAEHDKNCPPK